MGSGRSTVAGGGGAGEAADEHVLTDEEATSQHAIHESLIDAELLGEHFIGLPPLPISVPDESGHTAGIVAVAEMAAEVAAAAVEPTIAAAAAGLPHREFSEAMLAATEATCAAAGLNRITVRSRHRGEIAIDAPPKSPIREVVTGYSVFSAPAVVVDCGSSNTRIGFTNSDLPCIFPSVVGHIKPESRRPEINSFYIGNEALSRRCVADISQPFKTGLINNWGDIEKIWDYAFDKLGVNTNEHPVLITEPPLNPRANREKMAELLFEGFGVGGLCIRLAAVLSLFASGLVTGCVVESGDSATYAVPVYEGMAFEEKIERSDVAGRYITESMMAGES